MGIVLLRQMKKVKHAQEHYADLLEQLVRPSDRWLDIGCGHQIVPEWALPLKQQCELVRRAASLTGIDVDTAIAEHPLLTHRVIALAGQVPFHPASFDLVTANMVMEHIENPEWVMAEIRRLLVPGGRFVIHTPNLHYYAVAIARLIPQGVKNRLIWWLERRKSADIFPAYYQANTTETIGQLALGAGFEIQTLRVTESTGVLSRFGLGFLEGSLRKMATIQAVLVNPR